MLHLHLESSHFLVFICMLLCWGCWQERVRTPGTLLDSCVILFWWTWSTCSQNVEHQLKMKSSEEAISLSRESLGSMHSSNNQLISVREVIKQWAGRGWGFWRRVIHSANLLLKSHLQNHMPAIQIFLWFGALSPLFFLPSSSPYTLPYFHLHCNFAWKLNICLPSKNSGSLCPRDLLHFPLAWPDTFLPYFYISWASFHHSTFCISL